MAMTASEVEMDTNRQLQLSLDAGLYRQRESDEAGVAEVKGSIAPLLRELFQEAEAEPEAEFRRRFLLIIQRRRECIEKLLGALPPLPRRSTVRLIYLVLIIRARRIRTRLVRELEQWRRELAAFFRQGGWA